MFFGGKYGNFVSWQTFLLLTIAALTLSDYNGGEVATSSYANQLTPEVSTEDADIQFYDQKIREQQGEIERLIPPTIEAVEAAIEKKNLFLWAAFKTTVAGRILRQASASFDSTDPFGYASLLSTFRRSINGAAYGSTRLLQLEDVERTCGVADYRQVLAQYSTFLYMDSVFSPGSYDSANIDLNPDFLKYKACEMEVELKSRLSCLSRSDVAESRRLMRAIGHLIDLIDCRLDLTKAQLKKREEEGGIASGYAAPQQGYATQDSYSQPSSYEAPQQSYAVAQPFYQTP